MHLGPGARLGPYEIVGPLGAGGMGEVYRARDTRLRREVAVKVLPDALASDPERLHRFEQEALAASALNHPNVLTIHDIGSEAGKPFVVFELLEGQTLREELRGTALPVRRTIDLATQVANGIAAAHDKGIVHRDLKPENIFVTRDGRVKILDFGLAKLTQAEAADGPSGDESTFAAATAPGTILGTPGYMSPEQVRGLSTDARSDVFSFGVLLYEMLSGRRAFSGVSTADTVSAILRDEPAPLSPELVSSPLDRVVRRCLEKAPEARFQSARDLAFALDESALSAGSMSSVRTVPPRPASRRVMVVGAVVTVAALAALALVADVGRIRERLSDAAGTTHHTRSLAILPLDNLTGDEGQAFLVDGMTEALTTSLAQLRSVKVIARTSSMRYQGTQSTTSEVAKALGVDALVEGSLARAGDRVRVTAKLVNGATGTVTWARSFERNLSDVLALQAEIAQAIAEQIEAELTADERTRLSAKRPVVARAYEAYLRGRFLLDEGSEESIAGALAQFNRALEIQPDYAAPYAGIATYYSILPFYSSQAPAAVFPKARAAAERAVALDSGLAEAHASLGYIRAYYEWDWAAAEREFRLALDLRPSFADAHFSFSRFLAASGRMEEAIAELRRAEELDPRELSLKANEALLSYFQGRNDEALQRLLEISRAEPAQSTARWGIGLAYEQKGMGTEALAALGDVTRQSKSLNLLASLGHAEAVFGQPDKARAVLTHLTEKSAAGYVPAYYFAIVYSGLGDKDRAFEWLERAYQERSTVLAYLRLDPRLTPLRSDPRYADLVRRMRFPSNG